MACVLSARVGTTLLSVMAGSALAIHTRSVLGSPISFFWNGVNWQQNGCNPQFQNCASRDYSGDDILIVGQGYGNPVSPNNIRGCSQLNLGSGIDIVLNDSSGGSISGTFEVGASHTVTQNSGNYSAGYFVTDGGFGVHDYYLNGGSITANDSFLNTPMYINAGTFATNGTLKIGLNAGQVHVAGGTLRLGGYEDFGVHNWLYWSSGSIIFSGQMFVLENGGLFDASLSVGSGRSFSATQILKMLSGASISINGGSLTAGVIRADPGSSINHNGGSVTVDGAEYGNVSGGGVAFYHLWDGTLNINGANEFVGEVGDGHFVQSGGTHTLTGGPGSSPLIVGGGLGSSGIFELSGGALTATSLSPYITEIIGWDGTGSFAQTGGAHAAGFMTVGISTTPSASGHYSLSDGTLTSVGELIGWHGHGTFTQSGGVHAISGDIGVGTGDSAATGSYSHSGGSFTASSLSVGRDGASGSFSLSGASSLVAANEYVGSNGAGTFTQLAGTNSVSNVVDVGESPGAVGTYALQGGSVTTNNFRVGVDGNGTLSQSGGILNASWVGMGVYTGVGQFNFSDGDVHASFYEEIGHSGNGTLIQTGGNNFPANEMIANGPGSVGTYAHSAGLHQISDNITMGNSAGASGTYSLSGTGSLISNSEYVGFNGVGVFSQGGGTNAFEVLYVGVDPAGAPSTYTLSNGTVMASNVEFIGFRGPGGAFIQSGGKNRVSGPTSTTGPLVIAYHDGSHGSYELAGGILETVNNNETVGMNGSGTFTQTGGSNSTNDLHLGINDGVGTYNMSGGTLSVSNIFTNERAFAGGPGGGAFNVSGGNVTVLNALSFGVAAGGGDNWGSLSGSASTLTVGGSMSVGVAGRAAFTQTGGTLAVGGSLFVPVSGGSVSSYTMQAGQLSVTGSLSIAAGGSFTKSGGSLTTGGLGIVSGATCSATGGSVLAQSITVSNGGTLVLAGLPPTNTVSITNRLLNSGLISLSSNGTGTPASGAPGVAAFTQLATGKCMMRIDGSEDGQFGQVAAGVVKLAGTLQIVMGGGFIPPLGNSFSVVRGTSMSGTFSQVVPPHGYNMTTTYASNEVKISLTRSCPADLNDDGVVEDADFSIFASAYNTLVCDDPDMPSWCPSDLNRDNVVDDADFQIFVAAYDTLLCP